MNECIFCKIINKSIPSYKIYENDAAYAFLDISPIHLGHALVVPKKHAPNILEIEESSLLEIVKVVQRLAKAMKHALDLKGFNISQNNGSIAGQTVNHFHFHIVPRYENDGLKPWPHKKSYASPQEAEGIIEKIRLSLEQV